MADPATILVTGGAGYIGSHVCRELSLRGYRPVVFDNLENGHRWAVRWGPLEVGDLQDSAALDAVLARWKPSCVVHMAALVNVGDSMAHPERYYRNNVAGSLCLIDAMRRAGVPGLVFSSTCATYGEPRTIPIREDAPQFPVSVYGRTKLMVEQMLGDFDAAYGLRSVCLRYFNAAGACPDGMIGELHQPETHVLPLMLQALQKRERPFGVFGTDYKTPDGTCIRDYIHVCDLAAAHVLAVERLIKGGASCAVNLGTGKGVSVRELIGMVERVAGASLSIVEADRRPGDPPVLVADAALARRELGWQPVVSAIEEIVVSAHAWQKRLLTEGPPAAIL
ncbi:MAG: UDP-glucose 4-epimerase GalE [Alphaproteobacteria bacterium]|jgi:UDP-arabinose 4-epimerase|nr:UDP-glucose 4-epimerase GalE [Rhodospirillaceae bacterium]MDG2480600.1 UDP-glucose 4-epimerase GalE [Alphaproteobacteria bacterium]MBT6204090.1 UDP-glucose 4-epimerase GalE [Rhodospirillaceae bacterium]MBT6513041.1 UDP-glucose 4-epimerase GalE [Rhodospirillaceae bacterium]MBT7613371.1 UDP-glucose 4-epimerase GalE [Rhodospirillaceae bacterium]